MSAARKPFTGEEKAMWGIAYAMTKRTKALNPALRKAYGDGLAPPDKTALAEAREWARSIHIALIEACELAGVVPESMTLPCSDCKGSGEKILNPDWPAGSESYSEKCSTCGGTGDDPDAR